MRVRLFVLVLSVALSAVCLAAPGLGQTTFGTILGTVTGPSGAVMPNVTITVTNEGENISHNVTSDAQGNYQAENLKAGQYTVTAQVGGFKEVTVKDILLIARQTVRVDLKLVMGTAAEQVTVVANPELINTESQTISSTFKGKKGTKLPAITAEPTALARITCWLFSPASLATETATSRSKGQGPIRLSIRWMVSAQ